MSYRVEIASTGRAGCKSTECKKAGTKIEKGELRLGTWVEIYDHGGWQFRHWGCVTGKILQNIQNNIEDPNKPGTYRWDYLDGYEGDDKNSLERHPDLQEKVRRVITQGFIDPEDFNGDPEMNVLGAVGLESAASKKRKRDEAKNRTRYLNDLETGLTALAAERTAARDRGESTASLDAQVAEASKKYNEAMADPEAGKHDQENAESDEESKPAKKKRATKVKKETDEEEDVKPVAKKSRAKKVKKEEDAEPAKPAKKPRAKKVKKEEDAESDDDGVEAVKPAPSKKPRAKKVKKEEDTGLDNGEEDIKPAPTKMSRAKAVKKEADEKMVNDEEEADTVPTPAPKKRASRGKKAVKEEQNEDAADLVAPKAAVKRGRKVKEEPSDDAALTAPESSSAGIPQSSANTSIPDEPQQPAVKYKPVESAQPISDATDVKDEETKDAAVAVSASGSQIAKNTIEGETLIVGIKDEDLRQMYTTALEAGETEDDFDAFVEEKKRTELIEPPPKKKGGKGKKPSAPAAKSTRPSRTRTASKA